MNLRKDHYRLLVFTDLLQLKPPRVSGRAAFGPLVRALELRLACRRSQRLRLTARSHVGRLGEDGPRLPRYRTPFELARVVGCPTVQRAPASARVRDLPPTLGSAANPYIRSSREESLDVSPRIQNTTLYSGSFGSGVDEERS